MELILRYLNNFFYEKGYKKEIEIKDSTVKIQGDFISGQYIAIEGSRMNDGVYKVENITSEGLMIIGAIDEIFEGVVFSLAIPKILIKTSEEVATYNIENTPTAFKSESNQGYSYDKGSSKDGTTGATWVEVFGNRLKPFRKMYNTKRGIEIIGD